MPQKKILRVDWAQEIRRRKGWWGYVCWDCLCRKNRTGYRAGHVARTVGVLRHERLHNSHRTIAAIVRRLPRLKIQGGGSTRVQRYSKLYRLLPLLTV
jgi:hypothetical protein